MTASSTMMDVFGDDAAGYAISSPEPGAMRVAGWGFWSAELASGFAPHVLEACRRQPRGATLAIDMTRLKPMRDEGQTAFGEVLRSLSSLGLSRVSVMTTNPLTKLQLVRIATEGNLGFSIEWIRGENESSRHT